MLRFAFLTFVTLAIAIIGGAASVSYALVASRDLGAVDVGRWSAEPEFGTPDADPYSKARFAREGGLALGQAEGISFVSVADASGRPLRTTCDYRLSGPVPIARFWTLRATNAFGTQLGSVGRRRPALQSQAILRKTDGSVEVAIGPNPAPGNWLAVPRDGAMQLVLTLFDTPVSGETDIMTIDLPTVSRIGCDG